jgi:SPP1 gp7 family putative phage head morphogenesis protein
MTAIPNDVLKAYRDRSSYTAPQGTVSAAALAGLQRRENTRSVAGMAREMSEDYQVKFGKLVLESNIKAVTVSVSAEDGDERAEALADYCAKLWKRSITSACEFLVHGRVAWEKGYRFDERLFLTVVDLDPLPFDRTEMRLTEDGAYDGVDLAGKNGKVPIPAADSWWLACDPTAIEPHGKSRLAGAARKAYLDRQEIRRLRAMFLARFAIGWAKAHVQSRYVNPVTQETVDGHLKMQQAYEAMRSAGLVTFDNARATKADGTEGAYLDDLETLPVAASAQPLDDCLDGMDVEQLRALGIPEKTVMEGEAVGSFAMVSQQMRVLMAVVDDLVAQLVDSFQRYVVDKLVAMNWPDDEQRPVLVVSYPPLTEGPTALVVDLAKSILTGQPNPIVLSGGIDVPAILKQSGVPTTPELDEIWADPVRRQALLPTAAPAPVPAAPGMQGFALRNLGNGYFLAETAVRPPADGPQLPDADQSFMADLPSRRELIDQALDRLGDLYLELRQALTERSVERFQEIRGRIKALRAQVAVAGHVIGMVSPWRPAVASNPAGAPRPKPLTLALELTGFDFPWLKSAIHFLNSKQLLSDEDFALLDQDERAKALSVEGVDDQEILAEVQTALVQSIQAGEALPKFAARIDAIVELPKSRTETLFRTQTKQAFIAGQERALSNPVVAEEFPYVEFCATADTRVRDSHWELDGKVVRRGSPEHQLFLRALSDYNCRCTAIPLTMAQAQAKGVASLRDLGSTARKEYQNP